MSRDRRDQNLLYHAIPTVTVFNLHELEPLFYGAHVVKVFQNRRGCLLLAFLPKKKRGSAATARRQVLGSFRRVGGGIKSVTLILSFKNGTRARNFCCRGREAQKRILFIRGQRTWLLISI